MHEPSPWGDRGWGGLSVPYAKIPAKASTTAAHKLTTGLSPLSAPGQACAGATTTASASAMVSTQILMRSLIVIVSLAAAAPSMGGAPHSGQCRTGRKSGGKEI